MKDEGRREGERKTRGIREVELGGRTEKDGRERNAIREGTIISLTVNLQGSMKMIPPKRV